MEIASIHLTRSVNIREIYIFLLIVMPSVLIFPVNSVGATLAGIPLTTISKSYDWGGVFVVLELASLFCGCLLIGARNVSRHMIDPSKFE